MNKTKTFRRTGRKTIRKTGRKAIRKTGRKAIRRTGRKIVRGARLKTSILYVVFKIARNGLTNGKSVIKTHPESVKCF